MFSGLPPFFKRAQQNPRGLRLFLAWAAITLVIDGFILLLTSGILYMAFTGSASIDDDDLELVLVMLFVGLCTILAKFGLQAWLILGSLFRATFWIISNTVAPIALLAFVESPSLSAGLIPAVSLTFLPLVFFKVRARPWIPLILIIMFVPLYLLWIKVAPFFKSIIDSALSLYWKPLYVANVEGLLPVAWMVHSLIVGAAVAWLMPPRPRAS